MHSIRSGGSGGSFVPGHLANSSGSAHSSAQNSYRTLESMVLVLPSGTYEVRITWPGAEPFVLAGVEHHHAMTALLKLAMQGGHLDDFGAGAKAGEVGFHGLFSHPVSGRPMVCRGGFPVCSIPYQVPEDGGPRALPHRPAAPVFLQ